MLEKSKVLTQVQNSGIVAVVRGNSKEEAYQTAKACIKGGVGSIELAFTAPNADQVIGKLNEEYADDENVLIGAGTVLDAPTARIAIIAGARYIVSPSFSEEVAKMCNLYTIPYIPGCMTPTDIQNALTFGSEIVKLFPGSIVGSSMVSELHGPFPQVKIMVTGGVTLANLPEWFDKGAKIVGVGGQMVGPAAQGDFEKVTENAREFKEQLDGIVSDQVLA
ncbi:KHG/KDPG aldolase [Lentilactobacillus sunkii]|jgi:2-dehydro-3-deoxyphosphogluconate aldolase/(4S)-4-hydroxy-2-oxoglutarate aldolase|uniref:KHG/KDPG aldolase n=1 Tax=Lentilactobacillus sunkii TaxID=481719 RepID=A0A1E7XIY3_9LACO|nr:bifunctional 2-keto-4-hydroxyglutarate aldolase/2-keto-3-deoxy-6-phosphogluconate aldolase [Lentilactobacillus sunkii]OFA13074.1 KHG/KDPG aldolase [Lentilactobacillus sunkii]